MMDFQLDILLFKNWLLGFRLSPRASTFTLLYFGWLEEEKLTQIDMDGPLHRVLSRNIPEGLESTA